MNRAKFTTAEIIHVTGALHIPAGGEDMSAACISVSTDTRTISEGSLFVALEGQRYNGHDFLHKAIEAKAFGVLVNRDYDTEHIKGKIHIFAVNDTLVALGNLARSYRDRFPETVVAGITGSNGKTTVKELLASALEPLGPVHKNRGNLNNRIGLPLTILEMQNSCRHAVLEMGMNEPGEIAELARIACPCLGLVTGAASMHIAGLGSVDAVASAKAELYHGLPDGGVAVVNLDDPRMSILAEEAGALEAGGRLKKVTYGFHPSAQLRLGDIRFDENISFKILVSNSIINEDSASITGQKEQNKDFSGRILNVKLKLAGKHNAHNACGAIAAALALGVEPEAAAQAVSEVRPLPGRLEIKKGPFGSLILDDSYNSGPDAVRAAISTGMQMATARKGRLVAVLGDMLELGINENEYHRDIGRYISKSGMSRLIATGELSRYTALEAESSGAVPVVHDMNYDSVIERITEDLRKDDVVLIKGSRGMALERIVEPLVSVEEADR